MSTILLRRSTCLALLLAGCTVSTELPLNAKVSCATTADCPSGFVCDDTDRLCHLAKMIPVLSIQPIARQLSDVTVHLVVYAGEGAAVTLAAQYDAGAGHYANATLSTPSISGKPSGVAVDVVWHAATDLGDSSYRPSVKLKIAPSSITGGDGEAVVSAPFAFGNTPPVLDSVAVQSGGQPVAGNVIVVFSVHDVASDPVDVSLLEVSYDGKFDDTVVVYDAASPAAAVVPSGSMTGLATSPSGMEHRFTWSSGITSVVDSPLTTLRMTVRDPLGGTATKTSAAFHLRNQVPPRIVDLRAPAALLRRVTGPATFSYRLIDDNGDPADMVFEYSLDGGSSFSPCREYRVPESEGLLGLAATSEADGGVEHVFIWDASGISLRADTRVVVRAGPAGTDSRASVALAAGAGAPLLTPYNALFQQGVVALPGGGHVAFGDFNGDGLTDLALSQSGVEYTAAGCAPAPCFGAPVQLTPVGAGTIQGLAEGDLDEDGLVDVAVATTSPDALAVRFGKALSTRVAAGSLPAPPLRVFVADVDGDGHLDLVVAMAGAVAVAFGDGKGAFAAPVSTAISGTVAMMKPGRVDGDNRADFWVLHAVAERKLTALVATGNRATPFTQHDSAIAHDANVMAVADLDGDGLAEVVVASTTFGSELAAQGLLLESDATGALDAGRTIPLTAASITDLATGDVDGDGRPDLVYGERYTTSGDVFVHPNIGNDGAGHALFGDGVVMMSIGNAVEIAVRDFTGDGVADVIAPDNFDTHGFNYASWQMPSGIGAGGVAAPVSYWNGTAWYKEWATGDFNGDGIRDQVFNTGSRFEVWWGVGIRGVANGDFDGPVYVDGVTCTPASCTSLSTGDANGDGLTDLWFLDGTGAGTLRLGVGDGTFGPPAAAAMPAGFAGMGYINISQALPTADIDGDGILDAVWSGGSSSLLGFYQGTYTGTPGPNGPTAFASTTPLSASVLVLGPAFSYAFVGDIDDDGFVDAIVSVRRTTSQFSVLYGQNEHPVPRELHVGAYAALPAAGGRLVASATAADLVGQTITGHVARSALHEHLIDWKGSLLAAQLTTSTAVPLTAPYQLAGDVRLTTLPTTPASLRLEARLGARVDPTSTTSFARRGLDLSGAPQRGIVADLPTFSGYTATAVAAGTVHVYERVTEYLPSTPSAIHRRMSWIEIPRDADGDLTTGVGARFVVQTDKDKRPVVRVLLDRLGVVQAYLQP